MRTHPLWWIIGAFVLLVLFPVLQDLVVLLVVVGIIWLFWPSIKDIFSRR